jgi:hypothetical protein
MARRPRLHLQLAVLLTFGVAACGGKAPPSTSPIATTGVVGGTVQMSTARGASLPSILVSVGGTTLHSNVSGLGDFVIANVPDGPLELRFTGEGIAAVLPVGAIAGGETVTLGVRLAASEAAIESMSRQRGTDTLVEGAIEAPGLPLPANTIIVGGRTIIIPSDAVIKSSSNGGSAAALRPGVRVRVSGTTGPAGVTAREVVIL